MYFYCTAKWNRLSVKNELGVEHKDKLPCEVHEDVGCCRIGSVDVRQFVTHILRAVPIVTSHCSQIFFSVDCSRTEWLGGSITLQVA